MTLRRLCFVVLSHEEPALVTRLVCTLKSELPDSIVLVRHDTTNSAFDPATVAHLDDVYVHLDGSASPWGSWALTEAAVTAVGQALRHEGWSWLVLLSGTSYPIRPLAGLAERLCEGGVRAHLDPAPSGQSRPHWWQWRPFGADRARYWYLDLPDSRLWDLPALRRALLALTGRQPLGGLSFQIRGKFHPRLTPKLVVLRPTSLFRHHPPVRASQWWAVDRRSADELMVLTDPASPWYRHFRRTFTSDELGPPSLLTASGAMIGVMSLHAQWWPEGPSPQVLTQDRLPWIASRDEYFVRKVSLAADPGLLDALDALRAVRR